MLQALSAVGNVAAGLISMFIGSLEARGAIAKGVGWKYMFLVGAIPAFLCVFIQLRLKEPEKWVQARAAGKAAGVKFGSYSALLGDRRWRGPALLGMLLCVAGVIGLWGIGFFSPELVGDVIKASLVKEGVPEAEIAGKQQYWIGVNSIVQNLGAFCGMLLFTRLAQSLGRKTAFAIGYVAAMVVTIAYFQLFNGRGDIWMSAVMGACQLALFAGFAIYLPELFPTSLRSTGTSFCYNVGRFVAATGPFTLGALQAALKAGATTPEAKLEAFRNACSYMSVIFLLGLVALVFLPETKGRPLPEDGKTFGRLKVRGPAVSSGYFRGEGGDILDGEGFFDTGDVATIDPDGYMQITDRAKDLIKSGGEWISSIALENAAVGHPCVAEAAVIAIAHDKWQERPLMLVVRRPGKDVSKEELLGFLADKVASWWLPDDVLFVEELPHTATGKLQKMKLRQMYGGHRPSSG
jgi:acyl-CoA synthetase (AMP-forming)/AMP-acid ligase II